MKRLSLILIILSIISCLSLAEEVKPLKALIVTGQCKRYHKWQTSSKILKKYLEESALFDVDVAVSPTKGEDMREFAPRFTDYDVVVIDYEGENWSQETVQSFTEYIKDGGGAVFVHTGFAAINGSKEFDKIVGLRSYDFDGLGPHVYWENGKIIRNRLTHKAGYHPPGYEFVITVRNTEHPITKGLPQKWLHGPDDIYCSLRGPAENLTVLATAYSDPAKGFATTGKHEPMLYTVHYGKGRAFITTLGHVGSINENIKFSQKAMENIGFMATFQRGAEWAATGKVTQKVPDDFSKHTLRKDVSLDRNAFTIIEIPGNYNDFSILSKQTQWIVENKEKMNIVLVIHTGDLTKDNTEQEWIPVDKALSRLDGVVPYLVAAGNHDSFPGKGKPRDRDTTVFNKYLPISRFQENPLFGGHYDQGSENAYYLLNAGSMKFFVLNLEFAPREEVLDWANEITSKYSDHRSIVVTHAYTYAGESRHNFMWQPLHVNRSVSDRAEIWDRYVRRHSNIFMVLSGHYLGQRRETSLGDKNNKVYQLLANYLQEDQNTQGWLRIIRFFPEQDMIRFKTYSPILDTFLSDGKNRFELEYEMN